MQLLIFKYFKMITKKITILTPDGSYHPENFKSYECVYYFFGIPFWKTKVLAWKTKLVQKNY